MDEAIKNLSADLDGAYGNVMKRIESRKSKQALAVLSWVYRARRPLRMEELREALSVKSKQKDLLKEALLPRSQVLIQICEGLIHETDGVIQFAHFTVPEFFKSKYEEPLLSDTVIGLTCLTYLGFNVFKEPCRDDESLRERCELLYKFSGYAASHWADHIRGEAEEKVEIQNAIFETFGSAGRVDSMWQIEAYTDVLPEFIITNGSSCLHITAAKGLLTICKSLLTGTCKINDMYVQEFGQR
jgi:hypothetical protein